MLLLDPKVSLGSINFSVKEPKKPVLISISDFATLNKDNLCSKNFKADDNLVNNPYWLKARQKLLKQIKSEVRLRLGREPTGLKKYGTAYKEEFKGRWKKTSLQNLLTQLQRSRLVLGGDFHAFAQAQRTHLRILRAIDPDRSILLALECFESQHQLWLDAYIAGELNEADFLKKIEWEERWSFPFEHYRVLLDLARERKFPVFGVNEYHETRSSKILKQRDRKAARCLARLCQDHPESLVYCVYGDLHLAKDHLPKELAAIDLELAESAIRIFQNSERLYFRLARRHMETQSDYLAKNAKTYCVLGAPPWVKWQSYLMYLEQTYDRDFYDEDEGIDFEPDLTDHVAKLARLLSQDLGFEIDLNDLAVYQLVEPEYFQEMEQKLKVWERSLARDLIEHDRDFYLAEQGVLYLSRLSLNHASSMAGQYLHAKVCGRDFNLWNFPDDFLKLVWVEAVSFFCSKLINHKRKPDNIKDLRLKLEAAEATEKGKDELHLALDQRMLEVIYAHGLEPRRPRYTPRYASSYLGAARILGSLMGEKIYMAFRSERINLQTLKNLLVHPLDSQEFEAFYYKSVKRFESQGARLARVRE